MHSSQIYFIYFLKNKIKLICWCGWREGCPHTTLTATRLSTRIAQIKRITNKQSSYSYRFPLPIHSNQWGQRGQRAAPSLLSVIGAQKFPRTGRHARSDTSCCCTSNSNNNQNFLKKCFRKIHDFLSWSSFL